MERDASLPSEAAPGQLSGESNGRLHDLLIAVKDIHHALLMAENEAELFQQICNSLKQVDYVKFTWIGLAERGTFDIKPVASAGFEDGDLSSIRVAWDDSEYGKGPTGMAIKTGQPFVMRDIATDPRYDPWRKEALKRGYTSSLALPLIHEGEVIGALNVYSERKEAFGDQEVQFLSTVAEDIALGVRSLRLQRNLRESEAKYRTLVEQSLQGIVIAQGPPPRLVYANPTMAKILGYTPDELTSLSPKETEGLVHPEDRAIFFGRFSDRLQGKPAPPRYEIRGIRKDGQVCWLDFSPNRIEYNGQPAVQAAFVDITERKKAEDSLRESEEKYRALVENASDFIFMIDVEGRVLSLNKAAARLLRREPEEVVGKSIFDLFPNEIASEYSRDLKEVFRTGESKNTESRMIAQGKGMWIVTSLNPVRSPEGKVAAVMGVSTDITERKHMQDELQRYSVHLEELVFERTKKLAESERRFRETADLLPQIVFEIDENGSIQFMNRAAFAATGCTEEDFRKGLNAFQMFAQEDHDRATEGIRRIMTGETIGGREFTVLRRNGTSYPVIVYTAPIMREGKTVGLRGIAIDITERKRLEERLVESERLAAIGKTTAMVGHDLRNPLQGLATTVYLAKKMLKSPKAAERQEAAKLLDTVDEEVYYMDKIVSDLQDYAAPLTPKLRPTDAGQLIRSIVSTIRIPTNVKATIRIERGLRKAGLDEVMMRRVFTNLVTNAIQAMPKGGKLTIRAQTRDRDLLISFQDTGVGIPEEDFPKLFNPFFTTKAKGQGLGLPVCKRLVEAQGGSITVQSKVGQGSTFTARLPLKKE